MLWKLDIIIAVSHRANRVRKVSGSIFLLQYYILHFYRKLNFEIYTIYFLQNRFSNLFSLKILEKQFKGYLPVEQVCFLLLPVKCFISRFAAAEECFRKRNKRNSSIGIYIYIYVLAYYVQWG